MSMTGGGIKGGAVWGKTDKLGRTVADQEVDAATLFATLYAALGINPHKNYFVGSRPVPLVDEGIEEIEDLIA
jgi:hypothetical protein